MVIFWHKNDYISKKFQIEWSKRHGTRKELTYFEKMLFRKKMYGYSTQINLVSTLNIWNKRKFHHLKDILTSYHQRKWHAKTDNIASDITLKSVMTLHSGTKNELLKINKRNNFSFKIRINKSLLCFRMLYKW